ncbi:SNF2-related protein, partial [Planctomycetota bacterium]
MPTTATAPPKVDAFLLDAEDLRSIASDAVVRRGIAYFKESRVTNLTYDEHTVRAQVEGSDPDEPYLVEIDHDGDNELLVSCTCPFDWEPVCKHAIAMLLSYAARQPVPELTLQEAADRAVEDRIKRGRSEVRVRHQNGDRMFGTWEAWSISSTSREATRYQVQIRSLADRINHCTCPDLSTNLLGTCKHIEAVLHRLRKKDRTSFDLARGKPPAVPVVYLSWEAVDGPHIRLRRSGRRRRKLAALLDAHFRADGRLKGRLPEAFLRFQDAVAEHDEVHIGQDALEHAQRAGEEAAQRLRAERIRKEVRRCGDHIPGVRAQLYPYQADGVAFLTATGRAVLADDMGLGKTVQAIAAVHLLMREDGVRRCLVVCPASLKHQWAREIQRFTDHSVQVVQGNVEKRRTQYARQATFTIANYELVLRDRSFLLRDLAADVLVLDEAQRIKNWRTKTAAAIKSLSTRYAFVLTGTPLENRLEDLYSLLQVVDGRILGPLWRYLLDFHVTDERGRVLGYRNLSELRRRLGTVMFRRDRRLVRDQLPERIDRRVDVPLSAEQADIHDANLSTAAQLAAITKRRPLTPSEEHRFMAALQNARMACNAAGLVDKKTKGSPKLQELQGLLEELCKDGGHKVVVFSEWERMTAMAEEVGKGLGLGAVRLHGGVPT